MTKAECEKLIGDYLRWLRAGLAVSELRQCCKIATSFLARHRTNRQKFPRLQLRTVRELMDGQGIERPSTVAATDETFKKAPKAQPKAIENRTLPGL